MLSKWCGKYVGLPYSKCGRGPKTFDCWGLLQHVAKEEFGWFWDDYEEAYKGHGMATGEDGLAAAYASGMWKAIERKDVQPGDVVHLAHAQHLAHVGLMLDNRCFLHVVANQDSCIERLDSKVWLNRIKGFYRWQR